MSNEEYCFIEYDTRIGQSICHPNAYKPFMNEPDKCACLDGYEGDGFNCKGNFSYLIQCLNL